MVKAFENNTLVSFGDVNLAQSEGVNGGKYSAGAGGWPTIRYFNQDTGYGGRAYTQKTQGAICDELKQDKFMIKYVEEAGSTSVCDLNNEGTCSTKELEFYEKWKGKPFEELEAQVTRLKGMRQKSMKPELRAWLGQRLNVLVQLSEKAAAPKDEV